MFGNQAASMIGSLIGAGMAQEQANALAQVIGQCQANLVQRGSTDFLGPTRFRGNVYAGRDLIIDAKRGPVLFGGNTFNEFMAGAGGTPGAKKGTLAGPLVRDGTATLNIAGGGTMLVGGYFVKEGYLIPADQRVGAISFDGGETYDAIVNDDCLEPA
jgi:hypothetical protein